MQIKNFIVSTNGPGLYEITSQIAQWVKGDGLLTLLVKHTSASLLIQENADPELKFDFIQFLERLDVENVEMISDLSLIHI